MEKLFKLNCTNQEDRCNHISPFSTLQLDGVNPDTGRRFNSKDKDIVKKAFTRACNSRDGLIGVCCDPSDPQIANLQVPEDILNKYPSIKVINRLDQIETIYLSKTVQNGSGWQKLTPYLFCKISKANISNTENPNILRAEQFTDDCFTRNCDLTQKEIGFSNLISQVKNDMKYTYFDDAKVVESIKADEDNNVQTYINKYQNVDQALTNDDRQNRMIHIAARFNSKKTLDLLVKNSADLNIKNFRGETPLHIAAKNNNLELVFNLINLGVNNREKNQKGETPIFEAVKNGDMRVIRVFYNNGASVLDKDSDNNNLIHISVLKGNNKREVIRFLIDRGVSVKELNKDNKTALDLIYENISKVEQAANQNILIEGFQNRNQTNSRNNINKNNNLVNANNVRQLELNQEQKESHNIASILRKQHYLENKDAYSNDITGKLPYGSPVEYDTSICSNGDATGKESTQQECNNVDGKFGHYKSYTTKVNISYYPAKESVIDELDGNTLYRDKYSEKELIKQLPDVESEEQEDREQKSSQNESHPPVLNDDDSDLIDNVREAEDNAKVDLSQDQAEQAEQTEKTEKTEKTINKISIHLGISQNQFILSLTIVILLIGLLVWYLYSKYSAEANIL